MTATINVHRIVIAALILLAVQPAVALAQSLDDHAKQMQGLAGRMEHPAVSLPFYRENTFLVLAGFAIAVAGVVVFRIVRRRRGRKVGPAAFVNEAVLVVDLVQSTHYATHYGNGLALRARSMLKDRIMEAAEAHGYILADDTGDGYFMTFPSVEAAVATATGLLNGLPVRQKRGRQKNSFA